MVDYGQCLIFKRCYVGFSSSPMASRSSRRDYEPNDSITPNTSFHQADEDMAEAAKLGIEPKNLMGVIMRQTFIM